MNSIVIVIVAIVVSLLMGYLLLACKRSLWPFTKKESFGKSVAPDITTKDVCDSYVNTLIENAAYSRLADKNIPTTTFSGQECTVNCPTGSTYSTDHNFCAYNNNL